MKLHGVKFIPINAEAKYGNSQLVKLGDTIAAAYWTGTEWAYRGTHHQLDFEPTHYATFEDQPSSGA